LCLDVHRCGGWGSINFERYRKHVVAQIGPWVLLDAGDREGSREGGVRLGRLETNRIAEGIARIKYVGGDRDEGFRAWVRWRVPVSNDCVQSGDDEPAPKLRTDSRTVTIVFIYDVKNIGNMSCILLNTA
jgi:hypothetical protein